VKTIVLAQAMLVLGASLGGGGQAFEIGIVDFYGINKAPARDVREALPFKEGDSIVLTDGKPPTIKSAEERLTKLPGVVGAHIEVVCCDSGRAIVFVGIQEPGAPTLHFRPSPRGAVRLPADIVQAGEEFSKALVSAVRRGNAGEDRSKGHSLMDDPAARPIQDRFIVFAKRDLALLRRVLRDSSERAPRQRQRRMAPPFVFPSDLSSSFCRHQSGPIGTKRLWRWRRSRRGAIGRLSRRFERQL
jgi:hypothetical protein